MKSVVILFLTVVLVSTGQGFTFRDEASTYTGMQSSDESFSATPANDTALADIMKELRMTRYVIANRGFESQMLQ